MNSRKANLRKLRLPKTETNNGPRNGQLKTETPISDFFSNDTADILEEKEDPMEVSETMPSPIVYSPPLPSSPAGEIENEPVPENPTRSLRTKLKTFLPKNERMKSAHDNPLSGFLRKTNDFDTPAKTIKAAPKTKPKAKTKAKPKSSSKKQQKIKSAFFQNEQLFSDVTAQHCLADNFNPDELQMALAISRSEVELSGSIIEENKCTDENEDIRNKLKQFGFRVAESKDFNYATAYKATKGKNKWANKFTPLTLRNSERQLEKLNQNIAQILSINLNQNELANEEEVVAQAGSVESSILLPFVAKTRIIETDSSCRTDTIDFYVLSLFEPSKTKIGYLLKDIRRIPGRDRSPSLKENCKKIEIDSQLQSPMMKKVRVDESNRSGECELFPSIEADQNESIESSMPSTISGPSDCKQRRRKTPSVLSELQNNPSDSMDTGLTLSDDILTASLPETGSLTTTNQSEINTQAQSEPQTQRATSPDIFADSDVEMDDGSEMERLKLTSSEEKIESYEIFSSDEVKTISDSTVDNCDKNHNSLTAIIDLTQQGSETSSQNSLKLTPTPEILQTYQEEPSTSFQAQFSSETVVKSNCETNSSFESKRKYEFSFESSASDDFFKSTSFNKTTSSKEESIETYQEQPSTSFQAQFSSEILVKSNCETNSSFESKRKHEFSFGSSASDDFFKSTSFNKTTTSKEESIDLTQNDEEDIDCIVLSDDEVNYSIRKADKSMHFKEEKDSSFESDTKENREFSFVDFVSATQPLATQSEDFDLDFTEKSNHSDFGITKEQSPFETLNKTPEKNKPLEFDILDEHSPFDSPLKTPKKTPTGSPEKYFDIFLEQFRFKTPPNTPKTTPSKSPKNKPLDFGILDEQSPFKTPTKTPRKTPKKSPKNSNTKCRRTLSESFLGPSMESSEPLKRFSSSNKFKEFTKNEEESFSDLDDIDKLIYGSPSKKIYKKPTGLTQLLTGPINEKVVSPAKSSDGEVPQEFDFNGRTYLVRTVDVSQRPNFATMDESTLLDKLYRYGIKPLKRKQAEKLLEYIYNQTHPYLVDEGDLPPSVPASTSDNDADLPSQISNDDESDINEELPATSSSKFNFRDCWGQVLLSDCTPSMEIKDEQYFFQTNTSKKISTAALPLHIAWYNLLKSNTQLHEAILYFEPIDLQEVYLFLKSIGYRYNPKDMKYFFDSRSIIFRYDVKKSENAANNRHVRKKRQKN